MAPETREIEEPKPAVPPTASALETKGSGAVTTWTPRNDGQVEDRGRLLMVALSYVSNDFKVYFSLLAILFI